MIYSTIGRFCLSASAEEFVSLITEESGRNGGGATTDKAAILPGRLGVIGTGNITGAEFLSFAWLKKAKLKPEYTQ